MNQRTSTSTASHRDRIRLLGFNPEQLTPHEQAEFVELHFHLASRTSEVTRLLGGAAEVGSHPRPAAIPT